MNLNHRLDRFFTYLALASTSETGLISSTHYHASAAIPLSVLFGPVSESHRTSRQRDETEQADTRR